MATNTVKPPIKETVGAQYMCFNTMDENGEWTTEFETDVEKSKTVKTVKVKENSEENNQYASGEIYDTDTSITSSEIEVEVIAFSDITMCKMRGDNVDEGGLILSGGKRPRPFFAYGKVVKLKGDKVRLDWYPKCKLITNSDEASTSEDKAKEQTDTVTIKAYPFNSAGDIASKVASDVNWPEGLTEEKYFSKVILDQAGLTSVITVTAQ